MEGDGFERHRVIIDTDPGIDDALALFVALAHLQVEGNCSLTITKRSNMKGITISGTGNNDDVNLLASNACKILELSNTTQKPYIYKGVFIFDIFFLYLSLLEGSNMPLEGKYKDLGGKLCHGQNGLGELLFEPPNNSYLIDSSLSAEGTRVCHLIIIKCICNKTLSTPTICTNFKEFIVKKCIENSKEIIIIALAPFTNLANV